jgi:hypothetical protein
MKKFAVMLSAFVLTQSAGAVAGDQSAAPRAKPSSFVPHPRTNSHVYGAPIQSAIVGHAKTSHQKLKPKKPPPGKK